MNLTFPGKVFFISGLGLRQYRRLSQAVFVLLFLVFFFNLRDFRADWPSDAFLLVSPLNALALFLSTGAFELVYLAAGVILILTYFFGRFFCGWICPLGTCIDLSDRLIARRGSHRIFLKSVNYSILLMILVTALLSINTAGMLDPLSLLTRSMTTIVFPLLSAFFFGIYRLSARFSIGEEVFSSILYHLQQTILPLQQPFFINSMFIIALFGAALGGGFFSRRFWCRYICPLGALLAIMARRRRLTLQIFDNCRTCSVCEECRMGAVEKQGWQIKPTECILCGECMDLCPDAARKLAFARPSSRQDPIDFSRRKTLLSLGAGGAAALLLLGRRAFTARLPVLRPPGAVEEEAFVQQCIRCLACVKACNSTGGCLQPLQFEAGIESIWTPTVLTWLGYCEYNCNLCGQVCPTSAIQPLTLDKKQNARIGLAVIHHDRCIPWRQGVECLVCEEHCPVPQKAIRFKERAVEGSGETGRIVKLPFVVREQCIGCGICEFKCPLKGSPGIAVYPI